MPILDLPIVLILTASAAAVGFLGVLYTTACLIVGQERWPEGILLVIALVGALLSLCATQPWTLLIPITTGALAVASVVQIFRQRTAIWLFRKPCGTTAWLACGFLLLQLLWAAAPFYRYDQWNYHLVITKYIFANHTLPPVIYDDHLYFTGVYEYLLLIPRLFVDHDLFIASFSDAFTFSLFLALCYGAARRLQLRWTQSRESVNVSRLVLAAFLVVTVPYQHSITNAKPEAILAACSLLCLANWPWISTTGGSWRWLGFLLIWPLGLKVTWLHAGLALGLPSLGFALRRHKTWAMTQGGLAGFVLILPWLLKNQYFFGNILHPLQLGIFRSTYWNPSMAQHWQASSGAAHSLSEYFQILCINLPSVFVRDFWPQGLSLAVLTAGCLWHRRSFRGEIFLRTLSLSLAIYIILTPLALDPRVQARFAMPVIGFLMGALLWCLDRSMWPRRLHNWLFMVMIIVTGGWDLTIQKLSQLMMGGSVQRYYTSYGPPYTYLAIANIINEHRQKTYGKAALTEHIVVQTEPIKYFYDSALLRLGHYDDEVLRTRFTQSHQFFCLPQYLLNLQVSYVVLDTNQATTLDQQVRSIVTRFGESLSDDWPIWHISRDALKKATQATELCSSTTFNG